MLNCMDESVVELADNAKKSCLPIPQFPTSPFPIYFAVPRFLGLGLGLGVTVRVSVSVRG